MSRTKKALRWSAAMFCALVGSQFFHVAGAVAPPSSSANDLSNSPGLVEQALLAGLAGDQHQKTNLLKRASSADGDFAPARWQLGEVKFDGQWRTPAEVAKLVAADERRQEYEALRKEASEAPADQLRLAKWAMQRGLSAEERYHWSNVLAANPMHEQARQRLGAQEYQGRLYTREQVAAEKVRLAQAKRDAAKFKPQFAQWCKNATSDLRATREKGLAHIRAINAVAAIPALRDAVGREMQTSGGKAHGTELALAMTAALAGMPEHPATLALTELSIFASVPEVRRAAAEALRSRPKTDFVPLLMASLEAPIEADVDVTTAPDGTVRMVETLRQQEPMHVAAHVRSVNYEVEGIPEQVGIAAGFVLGEHLEAASQRAGSTQERIDELNAASAKRNARIHEVLEVVMGAKSSREDVASWWRDWQDYNELKFSSSNTVVESSLNETFTASFEPRSSECFAPGTLVWKQAGPTPIEHIRVGDLVLSQHTTTGELAYRPVVETTVGPPSAVMKVKLPDEEFISTLGHRYWVDGSGWAMAKELRLPASLHSLQGSVQVEEIAPADEMECHNLVVDEFHTFVIGKSQLLVHDKTCPQPTLALTPGFVPKPGMARDVAKAFVTVSP